MSETHTRSVVKGVSWRLIASLTTMVLVFIFTGDLALMAGVGVVEFISKIGLYYLHERAWSLVGWGKKTDEVISHT